MGALTDTAGIIELGGRTAASLVQLGVDAAADRLGLALPDTPEALAQVGTISDLVAGGLPEIASVRLPGVDFESSNCRNFLVGLEYEDPSAAARDGAPDTLYAKLPCAELGTRSFANALGFWLLEVTFCQRLAEHVPIRVPRVYAATHRGGRFVLLLENLHASPGTRLFLNRDMAAGTTPERAERVLRTFAKLHAHFHGASAERREALLPARFNVYTSARWRRATKALNARSLAPARKAAPELVSDRLVETCRLAFDRWDSVLDAWYDGPLTLVHGDSHLGNCFEHPGAREGEVEVGLIDFQAVHWGKGMRDVQYFLINSMEPQLLEANEDALIRAYCEALSEHGVSLDVETARAQYRAFCIQTLMVGIVPLGLGALTERDETVLAILRRSTAALERLDFRGWVEGL